MKLIKKLIIFFSAALLIFLPVGITDLSAYAASTSDLNSKLQDLTNQLNEIRAKKKVIENQLNQEIQNQSNLNSQINLYDTKIQNLQLTIDEKTKLIETLETQISLTESQVKEKESKISDLEKRISDLKEIYLQRVQSNFQNSFKTPIDDVIQGNTFESFLIQKELNNSLAQDDQEVADELTQSSKQLQEEKDKIAADLAQEQALQDQVKAETADLGNQQQGLNYQKDQKQALLDQSKKTANNLQVQKTELDKIAAQKQKEQDDYLQQIIMSMGSGSSKPVHTGDPIGRMGRSGFVLTGIPGHYPDPDKEPCGGAHLHFEVWKNDARVNPKPYLDNGIVGKPLKSFYYTQYYGENPSVYPSTGGHPGVDLYGDSGCGTTEYAVADGIMDYYCRPFQYSSNYRPDPYYIGRLTIPSLGIKVIYMHLMKAPGVCG